MTLDHSTPLDEAAIRKDALRAAESGTPFSGTCLDLLDALAAERAAREQQQADAERLREELRDLYCSDYCGSRGHTQRCDDLTAALRRFAAEDAAP